MSYLSQCATRRPSAGRRLGRAARVDERLRLNLPGFHADAAVRVSEGERRNSKHKIDTLVGALERFRDALAAEAELAAHRERRLTTNRP
jgi:hypothetical protein